MDGRLDRYIDSASHHCTFVFCCIHGYRLSADTYAVKAFLALLPPLVWGNGKKRLLRKYSIKDISIHLLLNHHHGARLWPAAPLPFTSFAESCRAHVGPEPTFPPPSTLTVVGDAQSSKDPNLTLDRGDHFLNTFETLKVNPEANKSQKNSNMRNTLTAWFLQLHIVKNMTQ